MFKLFAASGEKAVAQEIAAEIIADIPPSLVSEQNKTLSVNKITRLLERSYDKAAAFQREQRLGFFGRAKLANHFKWKLKDAGYSEDFVDIAVEGLVVALSRAQASKPPKTF
jgi:hypothetical protein